MYTKASYKQSEVPSPLWRTAVGQALIRFRTELRPDSDFRDVLDGGSVSELLTFMESLPVAASKTQNATLSVRRYGPILKALDDLSAVTALSFGADATITAVLWGSLRVFISLASADGDIFQNVLSMLEDLTTRLPQLRQYEDTLQVHGQMEVTLLDLYTEIICFCARAITFLRSHPHVRLQRHAWFKLQNDFTMTMQTINRMSNNVDLEAELLKLRISNTKHDEVLSYIQDNSFRGKPKLKTSLACNVPSTTNQQFYGRDDIISMLEQALELPAPSDTLKVFAIYGIGGVGKTQIAREFVRRSSAALDAVIWVNAGSATTLQQSFEAAARDIASLYSEDRQTSLNDSIAETLKWLRETECKWLLVFDNVDDANLLRRAWPDRSSGSILITCRGQGPITSVGASSCEVLPFEKKTGSEFLLQVTKRPARDQNATEVAEEISTLFGGLPLALLQVGSFIAMRKIDFSKFIEMYKQHGDKIDAKKSTATDYEHTVSSLWEMPLSKLEGNADILLKILSFAQPDTIYESFLSHAAESYGDEQFLFMADDFSLGDAEETLLEAALLRKEMDNNSLSVHRLIQAASIRNMSPDERSLYARSMVKLLSLGFPDTWSSDVGHQHGGWTIAERSITHAVHFSELIQKSSFKIKMIDEQGYGELLLRCSWYLYEREMYDVGWQLIQTCTAVMPDKACLAYASAVDLSGLIKLDLNQPSEAMPFFQKAYSIRENVLGSGDVFLASSLNNIAMAHMEMENYEESFKIHQEALSLRRKHASDRVGNSLSNLSSLLRCMGKNDEAVQAIRDTPGLENFTDETFLQTGNPRFVGDMVNLSRIRYAQGLPEEALQLAAKSLNFRRRVHGHRYKTCDSMIDVAKLMSAAGHQNSAAELLKEATQVTSTLSDASGFKARAYYWLSTVNETLGRTEEAEECRKLARAARAEARGEDEGDVSFDEDSFERLTPKMLW